ncbi:putative polysaccharide export-assoiated protein [Roseovarius sp. TM1035]|nr:putative polysaccharide export-assoiated protein [Roseovarius sp. TM1035]
MIGQQQTKEQDLNQSNSPAEKAAQPSEQGAAPKTGPGPNVVQAPSGKMSLRPPARPAGIRTRHVLIALSFVIWVILPVVVSGGYLYTVARDQYASHVGFSVRTEEIGSAIELLGGITELSGSSSSDTDILYEFIQSPQIVRAVHDQLDMARIYQRSGDPVFTLGEDTRIEALLSYWQRMVKIFYDRSSGLVEIRVLAFEPQDARAVAEVVFAASSNMINQLSAIARADAMRYAEEELARAEDRLKVSNRSLTSFRNRTQIVDPAADVQGQMGLLNSLSAQMAEAQIELELLLDNANESDPRVNQANRKIAAIQKLINEERSAFGGASGVSGVQQYSELIEEYQALELERQFAEKSYLSALAARDVALAEAQRQSRYLATHISPTLAETAEYPQRELLLLMISGFLLLSWSVLVMVYYSLRDRR